MIFNTRNYLLFFSLILFFSCTPDANVENEDFNINIRLSTDPNGVNPMIGNPTVQKTEIITNLYLPLAHYDPITYDLSPVMIKELKPGIQITEGEYAGGKIFEYEILEDATWDDGTPITGEDYLFTLKAAKNPEVDAAAWRGILQHVVEVDVNATNPKKFTVTTGTFYHLAREASCTFEILPKHIYDPAGIMDKIDLATLNNEELLNEMMLKDSSFSNFAKEINSIKYTQQVISGSGPYTLKNYEVDQYIVLERKSNYWGDNYPERTLLSNNPKEITFRIIADESAAVTLLKDGSIDLINLSTATAFDNLKNNASLDSLLSYHNPALNIYYYISLNNRVPELQDKDVRRAVAHLFDVDNMIKTLENGYGTRQVGPLMPSSQFFNHNLKPIAYDPAKAVAILEEEGWLDSDGDGTRDKIIDGKKIDLAIDYVASQSKLGQNVGLMAQENAKQAGVKINMLIKDRSKVSEALYSHNFEASPSLTRLSLAPYDPYQRWHSDNSVQRKGNLTGYVNEVNDELIDKVRDTEEVKERTAAYMEFQELIYDEQPAVFLYSPVQKIVLNKKFKGLFTSKRPGYIVGSFELAK